MNINIISSSKTLRRALFTLSLGIVSSVGVCFTPGIAHGGIFVTNRNTSGSDGTVGAYTTAGAAVNDSLIMGLGSNPLWHRRYRHPYLCRQPGQWHGR